jgi:Putative Flp pilus-assembly TadE/G-like
VPSRLSLLRSPSRLTRAGALARSSLAGVISRSRTDGSAPRRSAGRRQRGQAGQALPLFVLMIFVITGSVAIVTDVSWFWVNQQHMQRAADAGALAGAVYLPGNVPAAQSAAWASTKQNGYTNGVGGVVVTPVQDAINRRRLDVTVQGPVNTYFARVFGLNQITASATSKGEFTLPVPMGSPQNYYGVGTYIYNQVTTTVTHTNVPGDTGYLSEGGTSGSGWSGAGNAVNNDNSYASTSTTNAAQQWTTFNLQSGANGIPNDSTLVIDGIVVALNDLFMNSSSSSCRVSVDLNWNNGNAAAWSSAQTTSALNTTSTADYTVGATNDMSGWGNSHTWAYADFANSKFQVRLTWKSCSASRTVSLDQLQVRVYYHTVTTGSSTTTTQHTGTVTSPTGGSLTSQGFWGAIITKGGSRENGDQFSPANDNLNHTSNPQYDPAGYDYTVIIPSSGGQVKLFDPTFCETGSNGSGGNMGAGDHWIGGSPNGVTTVYSLYNENGTPYDVSDDTLVATSGNLFANQIQADYSGVMGTPSHSGLTDCSTDPYHDAWWTLATGLSAGRYRINVNTSSSNNNSTNAENMWSAWVTSTSGNPQVYGEAKMTAYNNLVAGNQLFYLAQIAKENAGKTMEITLFDPGDVSGNAYMRILSPDGNAYNYATFSYTADNGRSGTNVTQIQTASSGGSYYNDATLTIDVSLPATYGSVGLTPSGETQAGWWKIEYQVSGGNDTTTWQVAIRGSPVHLVP